MRWFASVLLFLASAAPAQATICGRYAAPLDQTGAAQLLAEVRHSFPVRYKDLLDTLQPVVRDDIRYQIYYARTGKEHELVISSDYMRTSCLLTLLTMLDTNRKSGKPVEPDEPDIGFADKCTERATRLKCLLDGMEAIVASEDAARPAEDRAGIDIPEGGYVTLRSAVHFVIGHEIGHLLIDADPSLLRNFPERDVELAADVIALHTVFSGRTVPVADEFAFASHGIAELPAMQRSVHETSACRQRRAKLMRNRLLPDLYKLLTWMNPQMIRGYLESASALAKSPVDNGRPAPDCDDTLPPAVEKFSRDLAVLTQAIAALPPQSQLGETHRATIRTIPVETQFGRTLKASVLTAVDVAVIGSIGAVTASPGDHSGNARHIARLATLVTDGDVRDLTSIEYRNYMFSRAMGRFYASRPGTSLASNARRLQREIDAVAKYGPPDAFFEMNVITASLLAGQCQEGFAAALRFLELFEGVQRAFGRELRIAGIDIEQAYGPLTPQILDFARKVKQGAIAGTPETCAKIRTELATNFKRNFNWRD